MTTKTPSRGRSAQRPSVLFDLEPASDPAPQACEAIPPAPRPAPSPALLFDPAEWIYDAVSRSAVHRSSQRPCGCGGREFVVLMRANGDAGHVYCRACRANPRFRIDKAGDVVYGELAVDDPEIRYTRDPAEMARFRDKVIADAAAASLGADH